MMFVAGCGLAYQAACAHRANKMDQQLKPGLTMAEVSELFGEPDIEDRPDDTTEVWSYAKHANNGDVTAEIFYTSAKEGDQGTFEDLKFVDGKLVSWDEGQHTMAAKDASPITTNFKTGRGGGGRHGGAQSGGAFGSSTASGSSDSSGSNDSEEPFSSSH